MLVQMRVGRVLGLLSCLLLSSFCSAADAANRSASSKTQEVAIKYKSKAVVEFRLADYQQELLQCSALSAIHMWIGDNIGADEGAEVRKAISEDYWLDVSRGYLSLATQASGQDDLSQEVGVQIKSMAAEWRRLTETQVEEAEWDSWYELTARCDTWRPEKSAHAFYSKGREHIAAQKPTPKVVMSSK